jgi:hypothetical protein
MAKFELSDETSAIIRFLRPEDKGALISYQAMTESLGFPITSASHKLLYALKLLERDHTAIWVCVKPHVGIRRLTDAEIADRMRRWWHLGARNKLNRSADQADIVEIDRLDVDEQARFAVDSIQGELAREALSKATRKKIDKTARGTSNDLPSFTAVEWAISLSPRRGGTK